MFEQLNSPWVFGSVAIVTVGACYILTRVGYVALEKWGIVLGKGKSKKVSPHATCPHSKDIMDIIHRTSNHYEKVNSLKSSIIKEQMRSYEEIEEEAIGILRHNFNGLIAEKLSEGESFMQHPEYFNFNLILKVIAYDIKVYIRSCFAANHYTTYTVDAQIEYVAKKKIVVVQKVTDALNDYWRGTTVTRSEIFFKNKEREKMFEEEVESVFNRAFTIARDTYDAIDILNKEYQSYIDSIVGVKE